MTVRTSVGLSLRESLRRMTPQPHTKDKKTVAKPVKVALVFDLGTSREMADDMIVIAWVFPRRIKKRLWCR